MLTAVVTQLGPSSFDVRFVAQQDGEDEEGSAAEDEEPSEEVLDEGPSPIAPELKELAWGFGAFAVFFLAMRLFLFPKVKRGMEARYGRIRDDHERADAMREAAEREVAEYRDALVAVRAEATQRIDAARQTLDTERSDRLAEVNARIAERRAAAATEAEAAKAREQESIDTAVAGVAARATELAVGRRPDDTAVRRAVAEVASAGVSR